MRSANFEGCTKVFYVRPFQDGLPQKSEKLSPVGFGQVWVKFNLEFSSRSLCAEEISEKDFINSVKVEGPVDSSAALLVVFKEHCW